MITYKKDVLAALKDAGFSSYRLRQEKIIGQAMIQKIREGSLPSWDVLDTICRLLNCQPGDILKYVEE